MAESSDSDGDMPVADGYDLGPDLFTIDIPADAVQDVREQSDGAVRIEFTPEQLERFEEFARSEVLNE